MVAAYQDIAARRPGRRSPTINEANTYRNRVVNEAKGDAAKIVQAAQGYREQVVREAQGQAARFNQIYAAIPPRPGGDPRAALHRDHAAGARRTPTR